VQAYSDIAEDDYHSNIQHIDQWKQCSLHQVHLQVGEDSNVLHCMFACTMARFPYQYLFSYPRHYLSHLPRLEPWQMDRSSCCAWRQASTRAETGTGMVGEAAAPTTAATGVPGVVVEQQPEHSRCRGSCQSCCLAYHPSSSLYLRACPPPSTATRPIHLPRL